MSSRSSSAQTDLTDRRISSRSSLSPCIRSKESPPQKGRTVAGSAAAATPTAAVTGRLAPIWRHRERSWRADRAVRALPIHHDDDPTGRSRACRRARPMAQARRHAGHSVLQLPGGAVAGAPARVLRHGAVRELRRAGPRAGLVAPAIPAAAVAAVVPASGVPAAAARAAVVGYGPLGAGLAPRPGGDGADHEEGDAEPDQRHVQGWLREQAEPEDDRGDDEEDRAERRRRAHAYDCIMALDEGRETAVTPVAHG